MVSLAFNFMTHKELIIMPKVLDETHFFSLFLNMLLCHKNAYVATYLM
jgi:hypothetical protein